MTNPEEFKIICYKVWCGADATYQFVSKEEYDAARVFLDGLSAARLGPNYLPMVYPNSTTYFYVIDTGDREAFESYMRSPARPALPQWTTGSIPLFQ